MNANINPLLRTDEESLRRKKIIRILNVIAATSLVVVGLVSLAIFILIQAFSSSSIKNEQLEVTKRLSQFQGRQAILFVVNDRVENIDKILKIRKDIPKGMNGILAKIPNQLFIDSFEMNDKSVVISGQSKSLVAIGEFINNLTDMVRNKEVIKSLTLNSLILAESKNVYRVSVKSEL